MPCKLSDKQVEALFKAVLQSIVTKLKAGQPYDPDQYMRDLYGMILKRTNDPANAMDYIQHIPRMIITAYNFSEDIADFLTENGVSLDRLDQMRRDFKDIENIKKFVTQQQNQAADLIKDIVAETNSTVQSTPSDEYSRIEEEDRKLKQNAYKQEWFAYPATGLAVIMQEAKDYDGVSLQDNIIDDDPRKQTYFKVVRKINKELSAKGLSNASKLTIGPITGIYLRLVHATAVLKEDQYEKDKYYFSTTDNLGTPEQKAARRESGDEVHLVYSDKDGNFLYFDKEGNITTKEAGGTIAYTNLRRPRENNFLPGVQKVEEVAKKNPKQVKQIQEQRNLELDILRSARQFISKNRSEVVLFNVQAGNNGYTKESFDKPVKISSINLNEGFNPVYYTVGDDKSAYKAGGVYFAAKPYPLPVLIHRPKFENITNLSENLADIVFGNKYSDNDKINILKQFSYSKDTSLFMDNGVLTVSQKETEGKLNRYSATSENKQKFLDALKGQTVNIVGSLLGSNFQNPVNLDGKVQLVNQKYNNFISDNFFTYLQTNADGNLISLNAYNVIQPTAQTQKQIFGEVKIVSKDNTSLVAETPTDESLEDLKNKLKGTDFSLKKSTMLDNFAALDQIKAAEQWYKNSPLAAVAPFQMMFHVVNSDALAEFTLSGITLYKGANFTDLYHEGFHVFSQMFLTKEQKKALYNETRKLAGSFKTADGRTVKFKDALDIQLEEFLAEDFRKYVLSDGQSIINGRSTRNSTFRKILNFLKQLFKTGSIKAALADIEAVGTIKELYDNLYLGNIYQYKPSLNNVQFSLLNKGAQALDAKDNENKGLSYQDSSVLVQSIDSMIAGILSELNYSVGSVFTNPDLMGAVYEAVRKRLENKLNSYVPASEANTQASVSGAINFQEDQNTGYAARTKINASADATIALAIDFTSAGEKLTKNSVLKQDKKYIPIDANKLDVTQERVNRIVNELNSVNAKTLNIAGNGIYTMRDAGYSQEQVDDFTYQLIKAVVESPSLKTKITSIRTGGQTGFDEAGAKAAIKLGIPTTILAPKGWKFRNISGQDISNEQQFKSRFGTTQVSQAPVTTPENSNINRILSFALANWGDYNSVLKGEEDKGIIAYHKLRSTYLTFEERFAEVTPTEQDEHEELKEEGLEGEQMAKSDNQLREEFGTNAFERKGNEASVYELASNETIYLVKSLPKLDKNGRPELNILGESKLVDFNRTWGIIINAVQGAIDKSDMYRRLSATSNQYPELKALVQRLGNPMDKTDISTDGPYYHMWTKFFRDMDVYKIPIKELQVEKTVDKDGDVTGFKISFRDSDPLDVQVERKFISAFQNAPAGRYIDNSTGSNTIKLANVLKDFPGTDDPVGFLKAIGINVTDNQAIRVQLNTKNNEAVKYIHTAIANAYKSGRKNITLNTLLRKGKDGLNIVGRVRQMFVVEAKYSGNYTNNSITNVNDDPEFDLSLNNTITKLFKELNDMRKDYTQVVSQPHMAHFNHLKNPFAKYSIWLKSMFNIPVNYEEFDSSINKRRNNSARSDKATPVTIEIVNLNGIKSLINKVTKGVLDKAGGIKTANMDINSKFLMDLHTMLSAGVMELPRHASKSSAYGVSLSSMSTLYNQNARYLYVSTGHFVEGQAGFNKAAELLKQKVAAEMERIALVNSGVGKNITGFNEAGKKFTIFDDIFTTDLKNKLIANANADNSFAVVNSAEFSAEVNKQIVAYLEKLYQENKKIYSELDFISEDLKSSIRTLIKKDNPAAPTVSDQQLVDIALRSFTANAFIHNTEAVSVLYGDLALYNHNKEEFHKRNAAIGSTGRGFSWDQSDAQMINQMLGANSYAKSQGIEFSPFTGELNTAVFKDSVVPSVYYNQYLDALTKKLGNGKNAESILKPYTEMKEGDAQGWITFDAYKVLARLEGSWSPKQNEIYNKIINNEKVDPAEVIEFFPPRKYQYAGPLKTDQLHIQAFHKFSLVPMIPTVIKGTNLDVLHKNMLKQNMHYALFQSGSKMATITKNGSPDSLYENDDYTARTVPVDAVYTQNTVFIQYLKNQINVSSTWKIKTIFSTQLRKLIINDLFRQGLPINEFFGKLIGKYESLLDNLQNLKKQELLKEIGWKEDKNGNLTGNVEALIKFVRKELTRQDLADHDIEFIDLNSSKTAVKRDLSFSLNAEKIEKLLNTIVVKRIVRQKITGDQLVQVSGALYEKRGFRKASEEEAIKYGTNDLPFYIPGAGKDGRTSAAKIKIAIKGDYYRLLAIKDVKELAEKEGITRIDALNKLIKDESWLDKDDHRKMITLTGVRIPVQGANSMEFMEVFEFLPEEAGNIIILPAEIVAKSGGDFDIDKLTIFQANIGAVIDRGQNFGTKLKELQKKYPKMDLSRSNVNIILDAAQNDFSLYELTSEEAAVYKLLQIEFGTPRYIKDKSIKGVENEIIETIREILEHPDVFDSLIRPNNTDLVKDVADDLSKYNIQGYNHLANKTNSSSGTISPTRVLEPRYNLYKHESSNIGKKTLGIGAVDNSYSSIFKRIGAYLQPNYTYRTSTGKEHSRKVRILMPHNSVSRDGSSVISLSDLSTVSGEKISELISQLMNGWVDIDKDAWIFNINGNNTAGPVLLFLLEAGVDFRTAAYFVSQPLVIDYIKAINRMDSPFFEASGKGENKGRNLNKYNYKKRIIESAVGKEIKYGAKGLYENILKVADNKELTEAGLLSNIVSGDKQSKGAIKALVHFFELEDMLRGVTGFKLTVNVDTKPSKSFYAAQEKIVSVSNLVDNDIFNTSLIKKIITDSPIRSFFTQAFQLKVWGPLMRLRSDKKVNDFLMKVIKSDFVNRVEGSSSTSFKDAEKFAAAFKNDLPMFLMQNYLKDIDVNSIREYNGLFISESLPVEAVQLKYGAFVKDGTMYVDADQIRRDFDTKAYNGKGYEKMGLHKIDPVYFNMGDYNQNFKEYSHFVLEREYLRSVTPVQAGQTREEYEKDIAQRALRKSYNWYNMFEGPDSIASHFENIRATYPELANEYMIFEQVQPMKDKENAGMMTLKLVSERMSSDMVNTLHENLQRLTDFGIVKVADPVANREISGFFNRLIVGEYLRAGISKSSESLSKILPTENLMRLLEEPMKQIDRSGISEQTLNEYYSLFKSNWSRSKAKSASNKFRNYLSTSVRSESKFSEEDGVNIQRGVSKDKYNVYVFTAPTQKSLINKLLSENGQFTFVYPSDIQGLSQNNVLLKEYAKVGNAISIPVMQTGTTTPMTDKTYDQNVAAIDQALKLMEEQVNDGAVLTFPKDGLTSVQGKEMMRTNAPRTFGYLTTELYKRFGYVHPGAETDLGFRKEFQSTQEVSDEQVDEFMKKCFGN